MGFYLRKSVSVGPFRVNFSKSGVGVSAGVRGLRVGTGPRGNYIRMGRGIVRYQQSLPSASPRALPSQPSPRSLPAIDTTPAGAIVDSSSEQLLDELREKQRKLALMPFAIAAAIVLTLVAIGDDWPAGAIVTVLLLGIAAVIAAGRRDRNVKTVVLDYELDGPAEAAFQRFTAAAEAAAASRGVWRVTAEDAVRNRKYHAGASALVQRQATSLRRAAPPFVQTNVPVISLGAGRRTLYFLPDRLLVYDGSTIGAVSYATLHVSASRQQFIEEGSAPSDATVAGYTWRYVNRNGGPDRRFNNNRQIPICLYDQVTLQTASGLHEVVQWSRSGTGDHFADAVRGLAVCSPTS